eukprot:TRINITY_DN9127_c0_g1_i1.p1 TRINITY_DN9127_c0_g1~~TRINITY_DN9127_c0_g1_i1.p1  ORF type:complete len:383 (+),score=71.67 TRINITY_DN9127_c0_g1_i1:78-1226(+)
MSFHTLTFILLTIIAAIALPFAHAQNVTQIIESFGYVCEQHYATTDDGFVLSIQRIPRPGSPIVYLQHGVLDSANTWVMNLPTESLAFILADSGYDVWIGNSRGNGYSMFNANYPATNNSFWNWSWDEMALYDLPATLSHIVAMTGKTKLSYVGHSQGCTIALACFSQNATIAAMIEHAILLAPVAHISHQSSLLLDMMSHLPQWSILDLFGHGAFLPTTGLIEKLIPDICDVLPIACQFPACALAGCDMADLNKTRVAFYFNHFPMPTSVYNMLHWAAMVDSGCFCGYDWGSAAANEQHYGTTTPPVYNIANVTVPVSIFNGGIDVLADPTDVALIVSALPDLVYHQEIAAYGHLDFVWGDQVETIVYAKILQILQSATTM